MVDENFIVEKITTLRMAKNVSARDMSLSLGQSPNYINNIESKRTLPSIKMFLYICEFFKIEPKEFFNEYNSTSILNSNECQLLENYRTLSNEKAEVLLKLSDILKDN